MASPNVEEARSNHPHMFLVENISDFLAVWLSKDLLQGTEREIFERYYQSYKRKFGKYMKYSYDQQSYELMEILEETKNASVLEIGCGCGTESLWMAYQGARVTAIDIQEDRLNVARRRQEILEEYLERKLHLTIEKASLFDLSGSGLFDIVWMEQALHHIEPREKALDRITDLVKEGGFIIISEANAWNPLIQMRLLAKRGLKTVIEYEDQQGIKHAYGNERIIFPNTLCREFAKRGIVRENVRFFRLFPNMSWVEHLMGFERIMPQWLVPFFGHYNYIGKKISGRKHQ